MLDEVGILLDDLAEAPGLEELLAVLPQVQNHVGAARLLVERLDRERALPVGFRADPFAAGQAGQAGNDRDPVGHHERGVEAERELADQLGPVLDVGVAEGLEEGAGAGLGDGAQVLNN